MIVHRLAPLVSIGALALSLTACGEARPQNPSRPSAGDTIVALDHDYALLAWDNKALYNDLWGQKDETSYASITTTGG